MVSVRVLDAVFFLFFLALVVGSVFVSAVNEGGTLFAEIETAEGLFLLPLDRDDKLSVDGPVGKTVIRVQDGSVFVEDSDCRDGICIAMGKISQPSQWIACLPNRVVIRVVAKNGSEDPGQVDAGAF